MFPRRPLPKWASATIIVIAAVLLFIPGPARHVESVGTSVFAPIQLGVSGALSGVQSFWGNMQRVAEIAQENDGYREEIDRLQSQTVRLKELELENEALRRLLGLKQQTQPGELLPVRVIGSDISSFVQTITVDRGEQDGVQANMAVVTWKGLVGRVMRVTATTAKILLLTDANSSVSVRVQDPGSRATGIAKGRADGTLLMEHVPQQEKLTEGKLVITSGLGGVYPDGLVVGHITRVFQNDYEVFQRATVEPSVELHKLEHLYIILSQDEVEKEPT